MALFGLSSLLNSLSWFWPKSLAARYLYAVFCWLASRPLSITRFPFILHQLRDAGGVKSGLLPCPADQILVFHNWLWLWPDGQETTQGFEVASIASSVAASLSQNLKIHRTTHFLSHTTHTREAPVSLKDLVNLLRSSAERSVLRGSTTLFFIMLS